MSSSQTKLKYAMLVIGLVLVATGGFYIINDYNSKTYTAPEPEQDEEPGLESWEEHKRLEALEKPPEQTVEKVFVNEFTGETIEYEVGVENGVEETPAPSVLKQIQESYTEEQKEQWLEDYYNSDFYKERHKYDEARKKHNENYIKSYIDQSFTCETYKELAYKYKSDMLITEEGERIDAENYIYKRAFHECIDPKYKEELDEVKEKLEEVNEPN